jgi:hypothetical protein
MGKLFVTFVVFVAISSLCFPPGRIRRLQEKPLPIKHRHGD